MHVSAIRPKKQLLHTREMRLPWLAEAETLVAGRNKVGHKTGKLLIPRVPYKLNLGHLGAITGQLSLVKWRGADTDCVPI